MAATIKLSRPNYQATIAYDDSVPELMGVLSTEPFYATDDHDAQGSVDRFMQHRGLGVASVTLERLP